ncbi:MAG: hypothetical protein AB8I08_16950 [Sandaracinaceae bacterium]
MRTCGWVLGVLLALSGCDDSGGEDAGADAAAMLDAGGTEDSGPTPDAGPTPDSGPTPDAGPDDAGPDDAGPMPIECDYRTVDGRVVIEAENLPLNEMWEVRSSASGFSGAGYIEWTGSSHNNDPTHGNMAIDVHFDAAGRYRLQAHQRVGMGSNPTEHNDIFVRVADADGFYGRRGDMTDEQRVYPRPQCDDTAFTGPILAMPNVMEVDCPNGTSRDGWFKVYSSGALDWRWIANTSDNDGHAVIIEVDGPSTVTFEIAARADFSQLDRIVLHEISQEDSVIRDFDLPETTCE